MESEFTNEELEAEISRLEKLESACDKFGEADGGDLCRSQLRALRELRVERNPMPA